MEKHFKDQVLKFRKDFDTYEKQLDKKPSSVPPQTERRSMYEQFMIDHGASAEIISYSLREFMPTKKRIKDGIK